MQCADEPLACPMRLSCPVRAAPLALAAIVGSLTGCILARAPGALNEPEPPAPAPPPPEVVDAVDAVVAPRVEIREISGMTAEQATAWLAPVHPALEPCRPATPGLVHVHIAGRAGGTVMDVVGDTTLDALTRGCILSALSLYEEGVLDRAILEPTLPPTGDPLDDPPVVSSLITISW